MIDLFIPLSIFDAAEFFQWFVDNASYWFVFIFMAIESSFIPFPSEVVVPPAAYVAAQRGDMNVVMVVLVATAGSIVGALVNYYLSLWVGRPIVYRFAASRYGHACMIDPEKVERAEKFFDKHGAISTFIGRLVPVVRQLISIPAGLARMNIGSFILFTGLGGLLWCSVLGALGYWLAQWVPFDQLFATVEKYNTYLSYIGLGIGVACILFIGYRLLFHKKQRS